MKYKALAEYILNGMTEEQQQQDVTLYITDSDAFMPAKTIVEAAGDWDGSLNVGHVYLEV